MNTTPVSRPTVVLLHASASSARQWATLAERLAPRWRVEAVDFHGHGARPAQGGAVALKLAHERPQRVRSVLAYEPVLFALLRGETEALRETAAAMRCSPRGRTPATRSCLAPGTWARSPTPPPSSRACLLS